jgi:hypothetical protein
MTKLLLVFREGMRDPLSMRGRGEEIAKIAGQAVFQLMRNEVNQLKDWEVSGCNKQVRFATPDFLEELQKELIGIDSIPYTFVVVDSDGNVIQSDVENKIPDKLLLCIGIGPVTEEEIERLGLQTTLANMTPCAKFWEKQ